MANAYDEDRFEDDDSVYSPVESKSSLLSSGSTVAEELERDTDRDSMEGEEFLQVKDEISGVADEQKALEDHGMGIADNILSQVEEHREEPKTGESGNEGSLVEEESVDEEEAGGDQPMMGLSKDSSHQLQMNVAETGSQDTLLVAANSSVPLSLTPDPDAEVPSDLATGQRVLVGNAMEGTIQYIGHTHFAPGMWVGVVLDVPCGKNDGSVNGRQYFTCQPQHGIFAPPTKVQVINHETSSATSASAISELLEEESRDNEEEQKFVESMLPHSSAADIVEDSLHGSVPSDQDTTKEHLVSVEKDQEIQVNDITQHLIQQLSHEAFNAVHSIWKTKKEAVLQDETIEEEVIEEEIDEKIVQEKENIIVEDKEKHVKVKAVKLTKEEKIDLVTDQLMSMLLNSEVDIIRSIKQVKASKLQDTRERRRSPEKTRTSFSSEPLALVPSAHDSVCCITECAWNMLKNSKKESDILTPPDHLLQTLCDKSGVMLDCEKAFVHLVFRLAVELYDHNSTPPSSTSNLASALSTHALSLEQLQQRVFTHLHKKKGSLPSLRYIQDNRRPGGKEIDYVDCLLIKELRDEEPGWVDYSEDEETVKIQTADEILDLLIDETVDILNRISLKRNKVFKQ